MARRRPRRRVCANAQVVTFEVPPGRVQMKVTVEDASSMTIDSDARELTVPDLAAPDVGLSTPAVFRARTGPEAQALAKDTNAVPTIVREFRRTERLVIRSTAYGPGTDVPTVTARLLNRAGDAMQDLPVPIPSGVRPRAAGLAVGESCSRRVPPRVEGKGVCRRSKAARRVQSDELDRRHLRAQLRARGSRPGTRVPRATRAAESACRNDAGCRFAGKPPAQNDRR